MKVDHLGVAELEGLETPEQRAGLRVLLQSGKDRVRGAAPLVEQLDLLVLEAALGDQVAREDVEDAVSVELNAEEERLAQLRARDVLAVLVNDAQEDARLGSRPVHDRGGDAGDSGG